MIECICWTSTLEFILSLLCPPELCPALFSHLVQVPCLLMSIIFLKCTSPTSAWLSWWVHFTSPSLWLYYCMVLDCYPALFNPQLKPCSHYTRHTTKVSPGFDVCLMNPQLFLYLPVQSWAIRGDGPTCGCGQIYIRCCWSHSCSLWWLSILIAILMVAQPSHWVCV